MAPPTLPHIVLIVMDSASAMRLSAYGHHRDTSPGLRRLASQGVLYRHCFAPAIWTIPSHVSLFTGLYPGEHGCNYGHSVLPPDFYTLPEILREAGYRTVAISSNLAISPPFRFNRGFDEYYGMDDFFNSPPYYATQTAIKAHHRRSKSEISRLIYVFKKSMEDQNYLYPFHNLYNRFYKKYVSNVIRSSSYATERTLTTFKKIFTNHKETPLFLFINFMETHYNYNPPARYNDIIKISRWQKRKISRLNWKDFYLRNGFSQEETETLRLLYEQEIAYLDDRLAHLWDTLAALEVLNHTILIITADHGECLGEHHLWGHEFGVYNELIHIPLIIKYPPAMGKSGECRRLVQLNDIYATLAEVTDSAFPVPESSWSLFGPPRDYAWCDLSVLPFKPEYFQRRDPGFVPWETMLPCWAVIDADLRKLIRWADGRRELYDLKTDYAEERNLAADPAYRQVAAALEQRLLDFLQMERDPGGTAS